MNEIPKKVKEAMAYFTKMYQGYIECIGERDGVRAYVYHFEDDSITIGYPRVFLYDGKSVREESPCFVFDTLASFGED